MVLKVRIVSSVRICSAAASASTIRSIGAFGQVDVGGFSLADFLDPIVPAGSGLSIGRGGPAFNATFRSFIAVKAGRA